MSLVPPKRDNVRDEVSSESATNLPVVPPISKRLRPSNDDSFTIEHTIDIPKRVRITSLCLNRNLQAPEMARMVQGYYKGVLMDDVLERVKGIGGLFAGSTIDRPTTHDHTLFQELDSYLHYYSTNVEFMSESINLFASVIRTCVSLFTRQEIVTHVLDVLVHTMRDNLPKLGRQFVSFLHKGFDQDDLSIGLAFGSDSEFLDLAAPFNEQNIRFIEHLLETEAIDRLLQIASDPVSTLQLVDANDLILFSVWCSITQGILCTFMLYFRDHPLHRRHDILVPLLNAGIESLGNAMEAYDENDEYESDYDDASLEGGGWR
jgi:hypothetical protein